jgi:uncharacterized protein YceH (UPF0502 family)
MLNFEQTPLTAAEARVLATLMEKARTVPDSYPLTLNSLQSGCNQKSSREPVMNLSEDEIAQAIDGLRERSLVFESSGGRTARYEHNFERAVGLPSQAAALLGLLLLRGPQTAGELRLNAERWHRFADIGSVEVFLEELQQRSPEKGGPLVVKLERAPGAREQRWAQLLCGPVELQVATASAAPTKASASTGAELQALAERVTALEALVEELQQRLQAAGA